MENLSNITDIDRMKEMWSDMNTRLTKLEKDLSEQSRKVSSNKVHTAKEDLIRKYRRFIVIAGITGIFFPLLLCFGAVAYYPQIPWRYASAAMFFIFFMVAAGMDAYLYMAVRDINLATMSVLEVASRGRSLKRHHHIFQIILIPFAIVTLVVFAIPIASDTGLIIGMVIGGIVGGLIGLSQYLKIMRDYREIISQEEIKDEE